PCVNTYRRRFGSLSAALKLIKYRPPARDIARERLASRRHTLKLRKQLIEKLKGLFPRQIKSGLYQGELRFGREQADVVVTVCPDVGHLGYPIWNLIPRRRARHAIILLCLLNTKNKHFRALYVF